MNQNWNPKLSSVMKRKRQLASVAHDISAKKYLIRLYITKTQALLNGDQEVG